MKDLIIGFVKFLKNFKLSNPFLLKATDQDIKNLTVIMEIIISQRKVLIYKNSNSLDLVMSVLEFDKAVRQFNETFRDDSIYLMEVPKSNGSLDQTFMTKIRVLSFWQEKTYRYLRDYLAD